jgi:retron-type reverse transcriptase
VGIERDAGIVAITSIHVRDSSTRPLGISGVRDRVYMTAVLLVLEPIFEADLPSEIYAYRVGRNAQRAVVEME